MLKGGKSARGSGTLLTGRVRVQGTDEGLRVQAAHEGRRRLKVFLSIPCIFPRWLPQLGLMCILVVLNDGVGIEGA